MNYFKLTESELDMLLLNAFYPKKKERINFSDTDNFKYMILTLIQDFDIVAEFVNSLLAFAKINKSDFFDKDKAKRDLAISLHLFNLVNIDIKILKMAALKAYHDNKEYIRL